MLLLISKVSSQRMSPLAILGVDVALEGKRDHPVFMAPGTPFESRKPEVHV